MTLIFNPLDHWILGLLDTEILFGILLGRSTFLVDKEFFHHNFKVVK